MDESEAVSLSKKDFGIIERNTNRLQGLVDELLELSKIESGKAVLHLAEGDPMSLIKATVFSFESMAERSNIKFKYEF